jgi:inorganic pyrophosphatase
MTTGSSDNHGIGPSMVAADDPGRDGVDPESVGWVEAIVEIPKGSRNKYEIDHETGELWLDRHLFTATSYPADYGFVPHTLAEDGDPLDILVLTNEPTVPKCHVRARPIGVFWMVDEAGPDAKILAVPATDPRWERVEDLEDASGHLVAEIGHFFEIYKDLEPHKTTDVRNWDGRDAAWHEIRAAKDRYYRHGNGGH